MKTKYLIISLPSTGKTTLCDRKANELYNISRKPSGLVFLDFDIKFMRYVQHNIEQIRIDQTKLLISLLNSDDVIGVTGFATQFDFNYLFNCAPILFKNFKLRVIFAVPTLRRLGQAVYDCFMRSSSKYTSLFSGDDDLSMHIYPWLSVLSDVSRRYRHELFAFDYWYNARVWLDDFIKRVNLIAEAYSKNKSCVDFIKCYFFSLDVGRFIQDVYRLFVTSANYKNVHGINLVHVSDVVSYDFITSTSDRDNKINDMFNKTLSLQNNACIKQGLKIWFDRFRYVIPCDHTGICIYPMPLPPMVGDERRRERISEMLRKAEMHERMKRHCLSDDRGSDDAMDLISPLNDR